MKMKWFTDIYLSVFVLFFRIGQNSWSPMTNTAKAVGGVTWLQFTFLVGLIAWLYYFTGDRLLLSMSRPTGYILFGIIYLLNYYLLVTRHAGTRFELDFRVFAYRRRFTLLTASIALVIICFGFALFSAYYVHAYGPARP